MVVVCFEGVRDVVACVRRVKIGFFGGVGDEGSQVGDAVLVEVLVDVDGVCRVGEAGDLRVVGACDVVPCCFGYAVRAESAYEYWCLGGGVFEMGFAFCVLCLLYHDCL